MRPGSASRAGLHWVHCARTGTYTLFMVHPNLGSTVGVLI